MVPDSNVLFWLAILIVAVVALAALAARAKSKPRYVRKPFLTANEARVLTLLEQALPQHRVTAQVAMGALLKAGDTERRQAHATRNRFSQKIVDFAVVTRDTAEVLALIELDDRTHSSAKDAKRDAMTAAAGYRTIRLPSRPSPTAESVRAAMAELLAPVAPLLQRQTQKERAL
jgi:very-short-patch-repair endonuclease